MKQFEFTISKPLAAFNSLVRSEATVEDALSIIEGSLVKTAFVIDSDHKLLGIVTNGDIRRYLLRGGELKCPVMNAANRQFRAVTLESPREDGLRLFDLGFSVIPRIDSAGVLVDLLTPDDHRGYEGSSSTIIRARAPARISFAGGGTDLTYFFSRNQGLVFNAAIQRYAITTLIPRISPEIDIYSRDLDQHEHFSSIHELVSKKELSLLSATIAMIKPTFGFDMQVAAEFPVGSGLGGSSAVTASIITAFNELRVERWSAYDIAELAFQAERLCFKVPGGWQDHYAAAFGGFNLIEFGPKGNNVNPLRIPEDVVFELEESLLLFDTGILHDSGAQHDVQKKEMTSAKGDEALSDLREFCVEMHRALTRHNIRRFGEGLHQAWLLKKKTSSAISTGQIDEMYASALQAGALGGKILGAGGGGHILFFVPPAAHGKVIRAMSPHTQKVSKIRFDLKGAHSWRAKNL